MRNKIDVCLVIAWIFIITGIFAAVFGWYLVFSGTQLFGIDNKFYFYEAIGDGIFGIFFLLYSRLKNK
ncbi:hypothetical protein GOV12_05995 [Candidatus Pacearchaeota archaeon]|nr:hypothetical protein [Candidatus Pacearchaeota archaeon]